MRVVATKSFAASVSMHKGEEREIGSGPTLSALLKAGYVKTLEQLEEDAISEEMVTVEKKGGTKKAGAKN